MDKKTFIEIVALSVQKYAPTYGVKVYSPIIAQACLESGYGTSELATKAHNYFGIKYSTEVSEKSAYIKVGSEQNANGTYTSSVMKWCAFSSIDKCVEGYFKFLFKRKGITRYNNLIGVTNPKTYLENIKADGYATSLKYVDNLMSVINSNNLTIYDKTTIVKEEKTMGYTNSPLVNYTKISPKKTKNRTHAIDTISIHCMGGNLSVESCGNVFQTREASSNYGIGSDGRIALYVDEKDRSWCTSNAANDNRAVTIEVANDGGAPDWHVSEKAMASLIKLLVDICKRNNIKKLVWSTNKNDRVNHLNGCNMTVHRDYKAKACPGNYLYNKHGWIAEQVNKELCGGAPSAAPEVPASQPAAKPDAASTPASAFIVKVKVASLNIRSGPGTNYAITGKITDKGKYTIVEVKGSFGKLKSGKGWISIANAYVDKL